MAAHTQRRAPILVMFVVCLRAHVQFWRFDKADTTADVHDSAITFPPPPPHSDTTIFQLRAHWVWISWSIGSKKSFGHAAGGSRTLDSLPERPTPNPLGSTG